MTAMTSRFWNAAMLVLPVTGALMTLGFLAILTSSAALANAPLWLPAYLTACLPAGIALSWMLAPTIGAWLVAPAKAATMPDQSVTHAFFNDEGTVRLTAANDLAANDDQRDADPAAARTDCIVFTDEDYIRRLA